MKTAKSKTRIFALLFAGMLILMSMVSNYTGLESFAADDAETVETFPDLTVEQSFLISGQRPDESEMDLTCEYILKGKEGSEPLPDGESGEYKFSLTKDDKIIITPVGEGETVDADHKIVFPHAGVFEYTITPVHKDAKKSYTYDESEYTVRFYVENTETGGLLIKVVFEASDGTKPASISYRHIYEGELYPVKIDPPLKKVVRGDPSKDATFHFTMKALPKKSKLPEGMTKLPMPRGTTKQSVTKAVKGPGEYEFGWITYTAPGTYVYKVFEEKDGLKGYTYDRTVYEVKCVVTQSGDKLVQKTTITNKSLLGKDGKIIFTNRYSDDPSDIRTGDVANILLWVIVAAASAAILILLLKKHKHSNDQ